MPVKIKFNRGLSCLLIFSLLIISIFSITLITSARSYAVSESDRHSSVNFDSNNTYYVEDDDYLQAVQSQLFSETDFCFFTVPVCNIIQRLIDYFILSDEIHLQLNPFKVAKFFHSKDGMT